MIRTSDSSGIGQPSGERATIKWVTVGGRTSAYVVELQKLLNISPALPDETKVRFMHR